MGNKVIAVSILCGMIISCMTTSGSLMSHNDNKYFKESPTIVITEDECFLRWRYSSEGMIFYMIAESNIVNDKLIFNVSGTTSTGNPSGRRHLQGIRDEAKKKLAMNGGAYWKEPDGTLVQLNVEKISKADQVYLREWEIKNVEPR